MTALVVDRIGLLVTNDPALGDGPLGLVRDAAVVIEGERVGGDRAAGAAADERIDAGGPLRHPGLRGQPHAPRVRRRPGRGVRGPHGRPALRGGRASASRPRPPARPATTTSASWRAPAAAEARARRHHPRRDQVRLRARRRGRGPAAAPGRRADRRRDLPRRPPRPGRVRRPGRRLRRARRAARCSTPARRTRRWIDAFCEDGAFDADQSRAVLEAAATPGLGLRVHANQLGAGPGRAAGGRAGRGVGRPLHLPDRRRRRRRSPAATPSPPSSRRPTSPPASPTPTPAA